MNVLKPELIWIGGRCYRVNDPTTKVTAFQEHDIYENEVTYNDEAENIGDEDEEFEIISLDNSRFATYFHVSKHYFGSIIGKKGVIKSRIESDTNTNIKIPRQGETGYISILGPGPSNVKAARRRINMIVMSSRMKQKPTHFLSLPMNGMEIKNNFNTFKERVLKEVTGRGVDEAIFVKPEKLHITMGVMCLMDNEERVLASKLFSEAKEKIVMPLLRENLPFKLKLKSLKYMNDDPRNIDVLYASVFEEDNTTKIIQPLADSLFRYYIKAGLMNKQFDRDCIKLHVTLMNTRLRNEGNEEANNGRESFDGTELLDKFRDYDFGVMEVKEIHLSQRHTYAPDGYYQATCVMKLDD